MKQKHQIFRLIPLLLLLAWINIPSFAQVSKGGIPPSFSIQHTTFSTTNTPVIEAPINFDVGKLKEEDTFNESNGQPPRVAIFIPLSVNLTEMGEWTTLASGQKICRLVIRAPRSIAMGLTYNDFYIPKGGALFIYNKAKTRVLGAYTNSSNIVGGAFATELVAGDEIILEYVAQATLIALDEDIVSSGNETTLSSKSPSAEKVKAMPRIYISGVSYGYNHLDIKSDFHLYDLNSGGSCMVNINCTPEGTDWQREKNGITRIFYPKGGSFYYCSGTLLNNTDEDLTPLILSAFHCFSGASTQDLKQAIFYFHYEQPGCANLSTEPSGVVTIAGATLLVNLDLRGHSDGSLVELNERVPEDYNLYWNGWDRRNIPLTTGVGIHHPKGDVMKISTVTSGAMQGTWNGSEVGGTNAHWVVSYSQTANGFGVVEEGSSGSSLFNQDRRVVGSLTGGNTDCATSITGNAYYGKLWYHWDQGGASNQMKNYLDPNNKGFEFVDGRFLTGGVSPNFKASKTEILASEKTQFVDMSYGSTTWYWEFPGGSPATSTEQHPIVMYNTPGTYSITLVINKDDVDNERTKIRNNYIVVTQKTATCEAEDLKVGVGTIGSDFPLGGANKQTYSASLYTLDEGIQRYGIISSLMWNAGNASDVTRKVYIYLKEVAESTLSPATWDSEIAGAKLVYESANNFINAGGWQRISLSTPYVYTGMKHLKVLVRTITIGATGASSSSYYGSASNKHMQWLAADGNPISGNGTVNSNRPIIQLGFAEGECSRLPVADFEMMGGPAFSESFDEEQFSDGWNAEQKGTSANQWMVANIVSNPFVTVDPDDKFSAAISYDGVKSVDSWLKTPEVLLPEKTSILEFYAGYNSQYLYNAQMMCYISTDNTNWAELWTTGSINNAEPWAWYKIIIDISAYKNQTVYLAWRYNGRAGDIGAIDNIRIFENNPIINLFEGELLRLSDKSTGPPVHWLYALAGATPATSAERNMKASYMASGTYNVSLTVKNNLGEDTKTNSNSVVVNARTPIAKFLAQGGYTRKSNNNYFIPKGGSILYLDDSDHVPTAWNWNLSGGTPSASTKSDSVNVTYNTKGDYDAGLSVTNSKGNNSYLIANMVRVGDTDTIWNMKRDEKTDEIYAMGEGGKNGYVTGTNDYKINAFSERFVAPASPIQITAVNILFATSGASSGNLTVDLCEDYAGFPGAILASKSLLVSQIVDGQYTTVTFPQKVGISKAFHIVVRGFGVLTSKVGIRSSAIRLSNSTASVYFNGTWFNVQNFAVGVYVSLCIAPEITYTELEVASINKTVVFDNNTDQAITVKGNTIWSASVNQAWVKLKTTGGAPGSSELTFACDINSGIARSAVIQLKGGGMSYKIFVQQTSGSHIANLKANLSDDKLSAMLVWGDEANNTEFAAATVVAPIIGTSVLQDDGPSSTLINDPIDKPFSAAQALRWDSGIPSVGIGYSIQKTFQVASLFYPEDISNYHGGAITAIEFYPAKAADFTLLVYQNEELKLSKHLATADITIGALNRVDISAEGIILDATKSLRVGFRVTSGPNVRPVGASAGPTVVGKGDLISNDDGITWLSYKTSYNMDINWILAVYIKKEEDRSFYRLYRNDKLLVETENTNFIDRNLAINRYCYKVKKVSERTDVESSPSNEACIDIKPVLTVTVYSGTMEYGDELPLIGELNASISGFQEGDVPADIITKWPEFRIRDDIKTPAILPIGVYPGVFLSEGAESNSHHFAYVYGQLTVARRMIAVTAVSKTKAYGDADGAISYNIAKINRSGELIIGVPILIGGETLTGVLSRTNGNQTGVYDITQGALTDSNNPHYAIAKFTPAKFTIAQRPVSIKAQAAEKPYGNEDPILRYTLENGIGEVLDGQLFRRAGESAGVYPITRGTVTDIKNPNYAITFIPESLTIKPRSVQVTADAAQKSYGDKDPKYTYTVSGMVEGEILTGVLSRELGENVGIYDIIQKDLTTTKNPNYEISYIGNSLQIIPKELVIAADAKYKNYGEADPKLTYTITSGSMKNGDVLIGNPTRITGDEVGAYVISHGTLMAGNNYKVQFVSSIFSIVPAPLFVKADDITILPGQALPQPTYKMNGCLPKDDLELCTIIDNLIYINARPKPTFGTYDILFKKDEFLHKNYAPVFAEGKCIVKKEEANKVTAFIPGSAGANAFFLPEAEKLQIFNRNGYLIYEGKGAWDGTAKNGSLVSPGIYYYVATYSGGSMQKGSVEVYKY